MKADLHVFRCMTSHAWLPLLLIGMFGTINSKAMQVVASPSQDQTVDVTGTVISDADNEGLPGVNVLIKGTSRGTVTDANGRYSIEVPGESILVFSSIGFETREIQVAGRTTIDVTMVSSITGLQEVVVVGYGTQKRMSMTNSVSQIEGDELVRRPVSSLQQSLQGKLPGLTILDRGGNPGAPNTQIVIRGVSRPYEPVGLGSLQNSTIGDNSPLVIVDGVEQPFQNINPADIESISVLKDASSAAIYGSRAANGVILITTKRAKEGKVTIDYNGFYALQKSVSHPEHMDIDSYLEMEQIAYANVGKTPPASLPQYSEAGRPIYVAGTKSDPLKYPLPYDWYNVMLRTSPQINHTLSVAGGSENFRSRLSLRSQEQEGIIANTKSDLTDVRLSTDFDVSPKITIGADINYRYEDDLQPDNIENIFRLFMQNAIWAVPKYPNGDYGGGTQGNNPLLLAEDGGYLKVKSNYIFGNLKGSWEITKGLVFTTQIAVRTTDVFSKNYIKTWQTVDSTTVKKSNKISKLTEGRSTFREVTINSLLNYSKSFGDHSLEVLAGYSQVKNNGNSLSAYRQGFYNNSIQSISAGQDDPTQTNGGADYEGGLRSYFGRVNYNFKQKYLFEANGRYDGSSNFTGDNQYSFFPSFSAGWRIAQEGFWSGLERYVSDLKLRGSWGQTGLQTVPRYSFYPGLDPVTYSFGGSVVQGYAQQQFSDPSITWETTTQLDIGLDAEFLGGRFSLTVDHYRKRTEDILLELPVPGALGLQPGAQNAGVVDNNGWEFLVGTRNRFGEFGVNANLNFSINNNKVVDLAGSGPYINGNDIDPRYITGEGYPINAFWGYKTGGLFQTQGEADAYPQFMRPAAPGDVKVLDLNGDGVINPDDMTFLANSFPKYTFGAAFNVTYNAFALNLTLQGASDVGMRIARALGEQGNYEGFTPDIYTDNYWTPEHPNARFARPTKQDLRNQASTDRMIVDASYLRLKNLQLSYQLPTALIEKASMTRASVYLSGTNLLTFSKLNKWNLDPESSSGWQNYYPQTSVYTIGVNLQF
jgi:TonB-linked SusC/RagA family outer membrane protein